MSRPNLTTSIATRLVDLLRHSGLAEGAHVTEQWAADELDVSRTPARKAMLFLVEVGILRREPNRGFFLARGAATLTRTDLGEGADIEEDSYFRIADDYIGGRFTGPFTTADVSRTYGLAPGRPTECCPAWSPRTWCGSKPGGRGWEFQQVLSTVEAHDQSYRFRMIIEPNALLEPGFTIDPEVAAQHRKQQEALLHGDILLLPRAELFHVNASFHEMLVSFSGNQFLLDAARRQHRLRRLIEYRHQVDRSRLVGQAREHLQMLDMIESGKREEAAAFLRRHLDKVREIKTGLH